MLDRTAILALIPHQGPMCLLDRALRWDARSIVCETARHHDPMHPLRRNGRLPGVSLLEPALQAAALHGALTGDGPARPGLVSSLRGVEILVDDASVLPAPLIVEAELLAASPAGCLYRLGVHDGRHRIVAGEGLIATPRQPP